MTATLTRTPAHLPALSLHRMMHDAPAFTLTGLAMAALMAPTLLAMAMDARMLETHSIWLKPLKFQIALALYTLTLAFFARYLPAGMTATRGWRLYAGIVVFAIAAEVAWIGGAAMYGTTSHFNLSTPVMGAVYGLMGAAAVILTSASAVMGVAIWRAGRDDPMRLAIALGLILTFALTVPIAGYLSSQPGHFVGIPADPGNATAVFGWSREVGDLRAPHFLATHALHAIPLAALLLLPLRDTGRARALVWLIAAGFTALTLAAFAQALAGRPPLPWL